MPEFDSIHLTVSVDYQALTTNVQLCPSPKHIPCSRIYLPTSCSTSAEMKPPLNGLCGLSFLLRTFRYGIVAVCMKAAISSVYFPPLVGYRSGRDDFGAGRF